jgi:hypothetical protein
MEHLPEDLLLRFVLERTSRQENQQIVRHLLASCPTCAAALRKIWKEPPRPPIDPAAYDPALDRFEEQWRKQTGGKLRPPRYAILSVL